MAASAATRTENTTPKRRHCAGPGRPLKYSELGGISPTVHFQLLPCCDLHSETFFPFFLTTSDVHRGVASRFDHGPLARYYLNGFRSSENWPLTRLARHPVRVNFFDFDQCSRLPLTSLLDFCCDLWTRIGHAARRDHTIFILGLVFFGRTNPIDHRSTHVHPDRFLTQDTVL